MTAARAEGPSIAAIVGNLIAWPVRQLHDEQRLVGVPGWHVAVRYFEVRDPVLLATCWQAVGEAAEQMQEAPVLLFRAGPDEWRAIWPAALQLIRQQREVWTDYRWTIEASVPVWAAVTRHVEPLHEADEIYREALQRWLQ